MTQLSRLFERLEEKAKHKLLQIMINRIKVDADGQILDPEFNQPFGYLSRLVSDSVGSDPNIKLNGIGGSFKVLLGMPIDCGIAFD